MVVLASDLLGIVDQRVAARGGGPYNIPLKLRAGPQLLETLCNTRLSGLENTNERRRTTCKDSLD